MLKEATSSQSGGDRPARRAGYLIRLDDIAPNMNWDAYFRAKALFDAHGVRPVLGVIPDNRDPDLLRFPAAPVDFWEEIRGVQSRGWEIAMHGYRHLYDSRGNDYLGMGDKSEFAGHAFEEQLERLTSAKAIFEREGVEAETFFAPSHTFDENTIRALEAIGVSSILDGYGLYPFHERGMLFVPQLVGRTVAFPFGVHTSVHHLNHFSESDFAALEDFVRQQHERILSYAEARQMVRDRLWNRLSGAALKRLLQAKRRLARLRAGGGALDAAVPS